MGDATDRPVPVRELAPTLRESLFSLTSGLCVNSFTTENYANFVCPLSAVNLFKSWFY